MKKLDNKKLAAKDDVIRRIVTLITKNDKGFAEIERTLLRIARLVRGRDHAIAGLSAEDFLQQAIWWDPLESTCRHASLSIL